MKNIRLQTKPYPAGDNHLLWRKPTAFGELRNTCELSISGDKIKEVEYWTIRRRKWYNRLLEKIFPSKKIVFTQYSMNARLNREETERLIDALKSFLGGLDRQTEFIEKEK